MIKLLCGVLAIVMVASVVATAAEPVGIEIRMRNSIGRLGMVADAKPTVKSEADGSILVTFQASKEGTYYLFYTSGPRKGQNATSVNVSKPGPVTKKFKPS